jgi:hypothetical protein
MDSQSKMIYCVQFCRTSPNERPFFTFYFEYVPSKNPFFKFCMVVLFVPLRRLMRSSDVRGNTNPCEATQVN